MILSRNQGPEKMNRWEFCWIILYIILDDSMAPKDSHRRVKTRGRKTPFWGSAKPPFVEERRGCTETNQFLFFNRELRTRLPDVHDIYRASINKNSWVEMAGSEGAFRTAGLLKPGFN